MKDILKKTLQHCADHNLLPPGSRVLVGLSGGPDSVALLRILLALKDSGRTDAKLSAIYLNHLIRGGEAEADALFCKKLARDLGVPLVVKRVDVPAVAQRGGISLEEAARHVRYDTFRKQAIALARRRPRAPVCIALGHHADDQVETVLHRIIRGTGVAGLGGIPAIRRLNFGRGAGGAAVIRPLLAIRRSEILAFLHETGQPYKTDTSNLGTEFTRNRLRNELLPLLREKYNPCVDEALLRLADIARQWSETLEAATGTGGIAEDLKTGRMWKEEGRLEIPAGILAGRPQAWSQMLLKRILDNAGIPLKGFGEKHYSALIRLARGATGKQAHLPGVWAIRDREALRLQKETEKPRDRMPPRKSATLTVGGKAQLPGGKVRISCRELRGRSVKQTGGLREVVDKDEITPPLKVRYHVPGDRFRPLGAPGRKKVLEFLAERRVPAAERRRVPIVADHKGIIWVVGHRIDDRVKITPGTRGMLLLTCSRLKK
jgi:tRNA(Ile)-lysidine synthase